mgnify:CR=1 FL=1
MVRGNFRLSDTPVAARPLSVCEVVGEGAVVLSSADGTAKVALSLAPDAQRLTMTALTQHDRIKLDFTLSPDDVLWGGGEQMSYLALNGRTFPIWTSEPGVGREPGTALTDQASADGSFAGGDYWTTNYPEPTVLCSGGWAMSLANAEYVELDAREPGRLRVHVWSGAVTIDLFEGAPADLVLFDPDAPFLMDRFALRSKSKNTPFDGQRMEGKVLATFVAGTLVFKA